MKKANQSGVEIRYDDFVAQVRPDPGSTEQIAVLNGYIGASTSEDKIRLYSDSSLNEYVDIVKSDILHCLPNKEDALGGSMIWVRQSASMDHYDANEYTQGDVYNDYMSDYYGGGAENLQIPNTQLCTRNCTILPLTRNNICRPTGFICPTPVSKLIICTQPVSRGIICPTRPSVLACPIPTLAACPIPTLAGCPIPTRACPIEPGNPGFAEGGMAGNEYMGGDLYNDYLQNSYGYGYEDYGQNPAQKPIIPPTFGGGGACQVTNPQMCIPLVTRSPFNCRTSNVICRRTAPPICWPITRFPGCPPLTCVGGTRLPSIVCPTLRCTTRPGGPGGFDQGYYDYGY